MRLPLREVPFVEPRSVARQPPSSSRSPRFRSVSLFALLSHLRPWEVFPPNSAFCSSVILPFVTLLVRNALARPGEAAAVTLESMAQAILFESEDKHRRMAEFLSRKKKKEG